MASKAYIRADRFAGGDALVRAIWGAPAIKILEDEQRNYVAYELQETKPDLPEVMDAAVGMQRLKDFSGDKAQLVQRNMPIGSVAVFTDASARGEVVDIDLRLEAFLIRSKLFAASPVFSGEYRRNFYFMIGQQVYLWVPKNADFTIIGITNLTDYASTLENPKPHWARPFNKVWRWVQARSKLLRYDARFRYLRGASFGYDHKGIAGDASPSSPNHNRWYGPRTIYYTTPIIEIGPLNSMGRRTGRWPSRHRRYRR